MAAELVPRFCILGGGVSGLTTAFFLQRSFPHARITLVEAASRLGGLVKSAKGSSGVLEQGFHSSVLVNRNGREALGLAKLLKLEDEVVSANIEASSRRHLFLHGRVQYFPRSQHVLQYCPALLAEPLWPRGNSEDESVHAFVARRTSRAIADRLADPVCRGQLAGDARTLSVRTCFPRLWFNERRFRSVFLGAAASTFLAYQRRSWLALDWLDPLLQRISTGGRCYSFQHGMGSVVTALEEKLKNPSPGTRPADLLLGVSAHRLQRPASPSPGTEDGAAEVSLSDGRVIHADCVIAALPPSELSSLLGSSGLDVAGAEPAGGSLCDILKGIHHESVAVVNISFNSDVLKAKRLKGAGYFVGSLEGQEPVLGMSWDSQLFPQQQGSGSKEGTAPNTTLTVYLGAWEGFGEAAAVAREAVRTQLGVEDEPSEVTATLWPEAVPQYEVGHHQRLKAISASRIRHLPWLQVAGPGYFGTRNVADEIVDARELADSLTRRFARFPGLLENETEEDSAQRFGGGFDAEPHASADWDGRGPRDTMAE
ncbi:unnamed protein product [Polarella glacialis]|uniref:Protoporphyrinogen oxidase n=1 Tax=Polarella glacialis TaxID=89957 RepID=A0A813KU52_POLGL|nr:unnamed protein product [Polarella glacialis]